MDWWLRSHFLFWWFGKICEFVSSKFFSLERDLFRFNTRLLSTQGKVSSFEWGVSHNLVTFINTLSQTDFQEGNLLSNFFSLSLSFSQWLVFADLFMEKRQKRWNFFYKHLLQVNNISQTKKPQDGSGSSWAAADTWSFRTVASPLPSLSLSLLYLIFLFPSATSPHFPFFVFQLSPECENHVPHHLLSIVFYLSNEYCFMSHVCIYITRSSNLL